MNNNDFEKKLENFEPPNIKFDHNKNRLRRELLNSNLYSRNQWFSKFSKNEISLASAFSILLLVFIGYFLLDKESTGFDELLSKSKTSYASFLSSGKTNYFDSNLKIYGTENEEYDIRVEKWVNVKENKYSIVLKDIMSGEILDKIIIKDDKIYRMKNPKLETVNTLNSRHMIIIELAEEFVNTANIGRDSISLFVDAAIEDKFSNLNQTGLLIYNNNDTPLNETYINNTDVNSMKVSSKLDFDECLMDNPLDLLADIEKLNKAKVSENFFDELTGKTYHVIQIEESILDSIETEFTLRIADSLCNTDSLADSIGNKKKFAYYSIELNDSIVFVDSANEAIPKSVKNILIDSSTGLIAGVDYKYNNISESTKLSASRFMAHTLAVEDNSMFDPTVDDLEYLGNTEKIKKTVIRHFKK